MMQMVEAVQQIQEARSAQAAQQQQKQEGETAGAQQPPKDETAEVGRLAALVG